MTRLLTTRANINTINERNREVRELQTSKKDVKFSEFLYKHRIQSAYTFVSYISYIVCTLPTTLLKWP